jgi:transposase-like protein
VSTKAERDSGARRKRLFLDVYARTGNISAAARESGICRRTHYNWLTDDEEYQAAFEETHEAAIDLLEMEARRRAVEGIDEPVIYQGELMGAWVDEKGNTVAKDSPGARIIPLTVKRYSDTLLIFLLKAAKPDKYRERREIVGAGGGPLLVVTGPTDRSKENGK